MEGMNHIISQHPAVVVFAFGAMNAVLAFLYATLKWFVKREFAAMEAHQIRQDASIVHIEGRLDKYDITFAVSQKSFDDLVSKIDLHIAKEDQTIAKVDEIRERVANMEGMMQRNGGSSRDFRK